MKPGRWGISAIILSCLMGGTAAGFFGLQSLIVMIPIGMLLGHIGAKMDRTQR